MKRFLVIECFENEYPKLKLMRFVDANSEHEAKELFNEQVRIPDFDGVYNKRDLDLAQKFWGGEGSHEEYSSEARETFIKGCRVFFKDRQDLADAYIDFYFSDHENFSDEWKDKLMRYFVVHDMPWNDVLFAFDTNDISLISAR